MRQCKSSPSGSMPRKVRASTGAHPSGLRHGADNAIGPSVALRNRGGRLGTSIVPPRRLSLSAPQQAALAGQS